MSTTVFSFNVSRPYFETFAHQTLRAAAEGGRVVRTPKLPADGLFVVAKAVILLASTKNDGRLIFSRQLASISARLPL